MKMKVRGNTHKEKAIQNQNRCLCDNANQVTDLPETTLTKEGKYIFV